MAGPGDIERAKSGQRAALMIAAVGVFWVLATWAGSALGLSQRVRALFDLFALAGFGWALWTTFNIWRAGQKDRD